MKFANDASAASVVDLLRHGLSHFRLFSWLTAWKRPPRLLRVRETLSLGSRGLIAVVAFQEQQFLVGCTTASIALLARLSAEEVSAKDHFQSHITEE